MKSLPKHRILARKNLEYDPANAILLNIYRDTNGHPLGIFASYIATRKNPESGKVRATSIDRLDKKN